MADYPQRPKFFANRYTRLIYRVCAAQEIGIEAVALCVHVAHTEDVRQYRSPPTFWASEFCRVLDMSRNRVARARDRAVAAGWLIYKRGHKSHAPIYWVAIPPAWAGMDDKVMGETLLEELAGLEDREDKADLGDARQGDIVRQNGAQSADIVRQNGAQSGHNPGTIRAQSGHNPGIFIPDPNPNPKETYKLTCGEQNHCKSETDLSWERFWSACPRKVGKRKARLEWEHAIRRLVSEEGMSKANARDWLCDRMEAFAASPVARTEFCPHPKTWLFQGRYHDDPETWRRTNGQTPTRVRQDAPVESERV